MKGVKSPKKDIFGLPGNMKGFSDKIIDWYQANKRNLPWRRTTDPYYIWLSEVILQQTRVDQGMSYYYKFIGAFPKISDLANADEEEVLKLWQGLGYYSRARNLHHSAKYVSHQLGNRFPSTYDTILQLKGVGQYTAAAISSIAFNEPKAAVDGNVYRVLSRVFGIRTPIDSGKGAKQFRELANKLIDRKQPGTFNQALMEFGATQCKPVNPACDTCTLSVMCFAKEKKTVAKFPVKEKRTKSRNRYFDYLVMKHSGGMVLRKRAGKDIWQNLYDFPLIETEKQLSETKLISTGPWKQLLSGKKFSLGKISATYTHVLSHQKIFARFWEIQLKKPLAKPGQDCVWIKKSELSRYAVPRLIDRYLRSDL